ncbi:MAG TPA: hypothetical protein VFK05_02330 [Polyangiaceae bacterium]|nr:hypothetical protein [Polyangiaceae bacterium]
MKQGREPRIGTETLAAYLEGELTQSESARLAEDLREDPDAQRRLEQIRRISNVLSRQDKELEGLDLVFGVRQALLTPLSSSWKQPARWLAAGGFAAAAGAALFGAIKAPAVDASEFQARSADAHAAEATRWAGVKIYRSRGGAEPELIKGRLSPGDGLLFAYTNLGRQPFDYLMLFAVGASGQIHWFYPAYEQLGDNPKSIEIEHGMAEVMLSQVVRHRYAPGPLVIYALFSRKPLRVLEVEEWLEQQRGQPPDRPPFRDASLQRANVEVE